MEILKYRLIYLKNIIDKLEDGICILALSKDISTYQTTYFIIKDLEKDGFITTKKIGRWKKIYLTEKGKKLKEIFKEMFW